MGWKQLFDKNGETNIPSWQQRQIIAITDITKAFKFSSLKYSYSKGDQFIIIILLLAATFVEN